MTSLFVIKLILWAAMTLFIIVKPAFQTWMTVSVIFMLEVFTKMTFIVVEMYLVLWTKMALLIIEMRSRFRTIVAFSIIEVRCSLIAADRKSTNFFTVRLIFGTLVTLTIKEVFLLFWAEIASSIFVLMFQISRATACIQERIPYFRYWAVCTVSIRVNFIGISTFTFLTFIWPNEIAWTNTWSFSVVPYSRSFAFLTVTFSIFVRIVVVAVAAFS